MPGFFPFAPQEVLPSLWLYWSNDVPLKKTHPYTSTLWRGSEPVTDSNISIPDLAFALAHERWWMADARIPRKIQSENRRQSWRGVVQLVIKGGSYTMRTMQNPATWRRRCRSATCQGGGLHNAP